MKKFIDLNYKQKIVSLVFWLCMLPYLLYSLFIQLVIFNIATFLFNFDIKTQEVFIKPLEFLINYFEVKE